MSTAQQLRETGEALGLKGSALTNFVKEQQTRERENREREKRNILREKRNILSG